MGAIEPKVTALEEKTDDTGWVNLTPIVGTWAYLRYRKIGNKVVIQGYANSFVWDSLSGSAFTTIPTEIIPTDSVHYHFAMASGQTIARVGVSTKGNVFIDWLLKISDGSNVTSDVWLQFDIEYYLD